MKSCQTIHMINDIGEVFLQKNKLVFHIFTNS